MIEPSVVDAAPQGVPTRYAASSAWHQRAEAVLPGGVNSNVRLGVSPLPLFFERGSGAHLFDIDGNRYIDYALGMGPGILGHAHDAVTQAVTTCLPNGQLFAGQHRDDVLLAEKFVELVPCAESVRFSSSGTEAVQAALRLARAATGRQLVVKFDGHYHGWLDNIYVSMAPEVGHAPTENSLESAGQSAAATRDVVSLPWNDAEALRRFLDSNGSLVAAVIMEPIMANTSLVLPSEGYLKAVRDLCDQHAIVLIFDEVITGFRVGLGGAQQHFGVTPDLATFGKALGGGFPISAVAGRRDLLDLSVTGNAVHSGTYNANRVVVAAALATLGELTRSEDTFERMHRRGEALMAGLVAAGESVGRPLNVQGLGTMFTVYFGESAPVVDYASSRNVDAATSQAFVRALLDVGVRPTSRGTWFMSTVHTDADIADTLRVVPLALAAMA